MFPFFFYVLGFKSRDSKFFQRDASVNQRTQYDIINEIYTEAVSRSKEALTRNGGIVDPTIISLGHGSKVRLWDYFGPNFNCITKERVGKIGDGGSKGEVSFEADVQEKLPNCEIHIFDPTLTFEQRKNVDTLLHDIHFHDIGLGAEDGELRIKNRKSLWTQKTKSTYKVQTLATLMSNLGHTWIDVLKIDIEGGEWNIFKKLFEDPLMIPATQIQIELHFLGDAKTVLNFFENMEKRGFRVFSVEPNYYGRSSDNAKLMVEYSFIQVDKYDDLLWNAPHMSILE
ncbi:unnamed protein product [Bathycoccus prasinos]